MAETIQRLPVAKEHWEHHSGKEYMIVCVTNTQATDHDKFPVTVVYQDMFGNSWSRPAHTFMKKFVRRASRQRKS